MNPSTDLTIVTSVTQPYVRFLRDWAASLTALSTKPAAIVVVGNAVHERERTRDEVCWKGPNGVVMHFVDMSDTPGKARNVAIAHAQTPWVMHLDADDALLPDALEQMAAVADAADVVQMGYEHWWPTNPHGYRRQVVFCGATGTDALKLPRIASGCSPFRRDLWERWHYPEHLKASWDYGLWLGFAHLGARFRPTKRPAFKYRQWGGSHWRRVGQHHHDDLLALRRQLELQGGV